MAKKKKTELLVCDCTRKSKVGKDKKYYEGLDCWCTPYPNGSKKTIKTERVFITSIVK